MVLGFPPTAFIREKYLLFLLFGCADKNEEWVWDLPVLSVLEVHEVLQDVEVEEQGSAEA